MSEARCARCPTKRIYRSWAEAEAAALLAISDIQAGILPRGKKGSLQAYCCDVCGAWHIGHVTAHTVRSAWTQGGAVTVTVQPRDWGIA